MLYRVTPRSYLPRVAGAAAQRGSNRRPIKERVPARDGALDKEKLYIGGGLVGIGAIWYYYATVENARIERKRGGSVTGNPEGDRTQAVEGASRSVKDRTKEALKSAQ
ncbi:hypothetical protein H4582DRAFT_2055107 [Lactarius indigo]|nr:hypothetical protein H4582DRAFT_2055107 [Lactarius indigo]